MTLSSTIRKTLLSTLTVAILATSAVSGAEAKDHGKRNAAIAGAVFGLAAALIGASVASGHRSDESARDDRRTLGHSDEEDCFEKTRKGRDEFGNRVVFTRIVCR